MDSTRLFWPSVSRTNLPSVTGFNSLAVKAQVLGDRGIFQLVTTMLKARKSVCSRVYHWTWMHTSLDVILQASTLEVSPLDESFPFYSWIWPFVLSKVRFLSFLTFFRDCWPFIPRLRLLCRVTYVVSPMSLWGLNLVICTSETSIWIY